MWVYVVVLILLATLHSTFAAITNDTAADCESLTLLARTCQPNIGDLLGWQMSMPNWCCSNTLPQGMACDARGRVVRLGPHDELHCLFFIIMLLLLLHVMVNRLAQYVFLLSQALPLIRDHPCVW